MTLAHKNRTLAAAKQRTFYIKDPRYTKHLVRLANLAFEKSTLIKTKPEIVHLTYFTNQWRLDGYKKSKLVTTVYDMNHELFPQMFDKGDHTADMKSKTCKQADLILAISESTRRDLIRILNVNPEKILVTPLSGGLDAKPASESLRKRPYVLFVGPRDKYKNFQTLLEAYSNSHLPKQSV